MADVPNIYSRAFVEAQHELTGLQQERDRLGKRIAQLEAFIANTEPLLSRNPEASAQPPGLLTLMLTHPSTDHPQPLWKSILLSINGKHERFTVSDALAALERIGRGLQSKSKFQIVRSTLMRRPEFEKIGTGLYRVRKGVESGGVAEATPRS